MSTDSNSRPPLRILVHNDDCGALRDLFEEKWPGCSLEGGASTAGWDHSEIVLDDLDGDSLALLHYAHMEKFRFNCRGFDFIAACDGERLVMVMLDDEGRWDIEREPDGDYCQEAIQDAANWPEVSRGSLFPRDHSK